MVEDSLFDDTDDTLPREKIIQKFQQWWTAEQIEEILKDHNITTPAFLSNIKQMQHVGHFELDHLQYATILYEQVSEKFLFSDKDKRYSFLAKVLKAVVDPITGQPSLEQEINKLFKQEWPIDSIPRYADEDDLREFLHTLHTFFSTKKPFLRELVEIIKLPIVCAQNKTDRQARKTETVDPIGMLNPLYDFQNDVGYQLKNMLENYEVDKSRGLIALPTGCGKTRLVVESIIEWINDGKPGQPDKKFVVWIVDKGELCDQAYDAFKTVFSARGRQDTSLKLHVFYGNNPKNLYDTIENALDESQSFSTSVIIASIGSLDVICKNQKNESNDEASLRQLGKNSSIIVIDEAHHAIADSYTRVLTGIVTGKRTNQDGSVSSIKDNNGLGFQFGSKEKHPNHTRLLGLTATPFRRESDDSRNIQSERLRNRFGGEENFFWPSLESSGTLSDQENHPHPVIELQQSATLGNQVKISGERSYDQDGKISEYYWQVKIKRGVKDYSQDPYKYDTGKQFGLTGTEDENLEDWKHNKWVSVGKEKSVLHADNEIFNQIGDYQVFLWVKDDDHLVCLKEDIRTITITEPIESTSTENQNTLKKIYEKLMERKVLAYPTRWILEHDSQKYLDRKHIAVTYKPAFGKTSDSTEYSQETRVGISEDPKLNEKIIAVIRKLVEEEDKRSILLFANTVDHARILSVLIKASLGYSSEFIAADTHTDERCKFIRNFRDKKITVLCNYDILTTGFDAPQVDAIINTRLTGSYVLYTQMIGRGLRGPKNGGTEKCVVVDFNPKIRRRTDAMSESEKIMAWRFHDDLFKETITLTNEKLGIKDELTEEEKQEIEVKAKARARDEEYERKRILESDLNAIEHAKADTYLNQNEKRRLYYIFKSHPEFCQMPEHEEFWNFIKKSVENVERKIDEEQEKDHREFYNTTFVIEGDDDPVESFSSDKEPEVFEDKLSFDDLMHFITVTMFTKANYQPVMISYLLSHPKHAATRKEIAEALEDVNIKPDTHDYEKVPVYNVLEGHNIVIREEADRASDDLFTLNVVELDEKQTQIALDELKKKIKKMEVRSEAARKANETRGPEARSEAARKANETRRKNNPQVWLYAVTEENWEIVVEKNVWGTAEELRMKKLSNADKMIFYVKGTNEIRGIFTVTSDWFESIELTWSEEIESGEIVYPYQIKLSRDQLGNVVFKNIKNNLEFVEKKDHYNMYLQMHMTGPSNWGKPLNTHDYELIRDQMNSNENVEVDSVKGSLPKPGFFDRFRKKKNKEEFKETYGVEVDQIKDAIDEYRCGNCAFIAKGLVELKLHQQEKGHHSDVRSNEP